MKLENNRFNVDCKNLTKEQTIFIGMLAAQNPDLNKSQILKLIIDMAIKSTEVKNKADDRAGIQEAIHKAVSRQLKLNASNEEFIWIGTGNNARRIFINRQEITVDWVQKNVTPKPSLKEINKYIQEHSNVVNCNPKSVYTNLRDSIKQFMEKLNGINIHDFNDHVSIMESKQWFEARFNAHLNKEGSDIMLKKINRMIGRKKVNYFARIEKIGVEEIKFLLEHHALNTIAKTDIPAYKAAIKKHYTNHPILEILKLNPQVRKSMNAQYIKNVKNRQGEREFYNIDQYLATTNSLLESSKYNEIALGLCAATGRRPGEIFATAAFKETENTSIPFGEWRIQFDQGVEFSGQMKTKGAINSRNQYIIPTLCSPKKIIEALSKLRQLKDFTGKTPKQVDASTSKQMGVTARKFFSDHFSDSVKPYDLRHAYALITATKYCDNPMQWGKFLSAILGHNENDTTTKDSYMTLKLVNEKQDQ